MLAINKKAEEAYSQGGSRTFCFAFHPPPKQDLGLLPLGTEYLRTQKMPIKMTYNWVSELHGGEVLMGCKPLPHMGVVARCRPLFTTLPKDLFKGGGPNTTGQWSPKSPMQS